MLINIFLFFFLFYRVIIFADLAGLLLITFSDLLQHWSPRWIYWGGWGGVRGLVEVASWLDEAFWHKERTKDHHSSQVYSGWGVFYLPVHVGGGNCPRGVRKHPASLSSYLCVFRCLCIVSVWLQSCDPKGNCLSADNKGRPCDYGVHFSELIVRNNAHYWRIKLADVYIFLSS